MNVRRLGILCLALLLDLLLGDPPNHIHPVAGMGAAIRAAQRRAPRQGRLARLGYGALLAIGGAASVAGLGHLLGQAMGRLPGGRGWPLSWVGFLGQANLSPPQSPPLWGKPGSSPQRGEVGRGESPISRQQPDLGLRFRRCPVCCRLDPQKPTHERDWPPAPDRWVKAGGWPPAPDRWVKAGGWPPASSRWVKAGGWLAEAILLKMTFSLRGLAEAADEVRGALAVGNLPEARRLVSWHLVSRDTTNLDPSQVAAATIESVAENASDGVVAPLLYYTLGGLPAALAYRFANTADAMLGYRDPAHEWLGKVPARLDDLANLLPARVTAGLLILAAALAGEDAGNAWRVWRRDASKTASPNAGHPMSAMAGALDIELEKAGHYQLGAGGCPPGPGDIRRAVHLSRVAIALAIGLLAWLTARGRRQ